jgi:hypothetical protein
MRASSGFLVAAMSAVLISGCSAADPASPPGASEEPVAEVPCVVGTWNLDVPDYQVQSLAYLESLGIPIIDYAMTGGGTITFTADGLVATDIDITTSGTLVAGDQRIPMNQRSAYSGSGDWEAGTEPEAIDLSNWTNVLDADVPVDPDAPGAPAIDYTDIPTVSAVCSGDELILQGPDAPLSAHWTR